MTSSLEIHHKGTAQHSSSYSSSSSLITCSSLNHSVKITHSFFPTYLYSLCRPIEWTKCCYSWCMCVYINKCVIWFHRHYPTQRDNNVTFLTTLCILLEYPAPCQDAQACSSPLSSMLPLPTTNKTKPSPYTVVGLSWWMIIGYVCLGTTLQQDQPRQSWENTPEFPKLLRLIYVHF